jgi:biopolymer transport protein ExbB/biopolymer transport protein TolQ
MVAAGSSGFGAVAAGIAQALITVALGLLVALPAVWLYNYFSKRRK